MTDELILKNVAADVVDETARCVYGFGTVCRIRNKAGEWEEYTDPEGDIIAEKAMVEAATDFMMHDPVIYDTHQLKENKAIIGRIVHSFPVTEDTVKSGLINTDRTGWLVGAYITDRKVFQRYLLPADDPNRYRSFSMGFRIDNSEAA